MSSVQSRYAIADLNEWVRLEVAQDTEDGMGGRSRSWSLLGEVQAHVGTTSTGELVKAGRILESVTVDIAIRYFDYQAAGVSARNLRVIWRGRTLQVQNIVNVENQQTWLVLTCTSAEPLTAVRA